MKTKTFAAASALFLLGNAIGLAQSYQAFLDGPSESPPNASPATGFAQVTIDLALHTLQIDVSFSGLTGTSTASHVHAPTTTPLSGTANVATQTPSFSGFPLGVTSGTYSHMFDTTQTSTWNSAYVTANGGTAAGAEAAFAQALADGKAYLNIHSTTFGGGEIRGFLLPVPEPATIALFVVGGAGLIVTARKSRRS
jgi:hypothetical protein